MGKWMATTKSAATKTAAMRQTRQASGRERLPFIYQTDLPTSEILHLFSSDLQPSHDTITTARLYQHAILAQHSVIETR